MTQHCLDPSWKGVLCILLTFYCIWGFCFPFIIILPNNWDRGTGNNWLPKDPTGIPRLPSACPNPHGAITALLDWALSGASVYCFLGIPTPTSCSTWIFFGKSFPAIAWVVLTSLPRPQWVFIALAYSKWPLSWPQWLVQGRTRDPAWVDEISVETSEN